MWFGYAKNIIKGYIKVSNTRSVMFLIRALGDLVNEYGDKRVYSTYDGGEWQSISGVYYDEEEDAFVIEGERL